MTGRLTLVEELSFIANSLARHGYPSFVGALRRAAEALDQKEVALGRIQQDAMNSGIGDVDFRFVTERRARRAIAMEARRAETGTGSVHDSAAIAQTPGQPSAATNNKDQSE